MSRKLTVAGIFVLLALVSCESSIGYGVVLWSENMDQIAPGTVVKLLSESRLNETYEYRTQDEPKQYMTSKTWRIARYSSQTEAQAFKKTYETYAYLVGESTRNGLPIRETNDRLSRIVYRMRDKEVSKIIERGNQSDEAGFVDYWYKILTQDGQEGWIFGYYLKVYSLLDSADKSAEEDQDPNITKILQNVWRPSYFLDMIENQQIVLKDFRNTYGLFPNEAEKSFTLVTRFHTATFPYTEIRKIRTNEYITIGNTLQVLLVNDTTISLTYALDNQEYSISLTTIEDINTVIQGEQERRQNTYQNLLQQGNILVSNAYGRITLFPNARLQWTGHETFTKNVAKKAFSGTGSIDMDIFFSKDISAADSYDGVFSLYDTANGNMIVHFAYTFTNGGIKLIYIPPNTVEKNIVQQIPLSPVILFFGISDT